MSKNFFFSIDKKLKFDHKIGGGEIQCKSDYFPTFGVEYDIDIHRSFDCETFLFASFGDNLPSDYLTGNSYFKVKLLEVCSIKKFQFMNDIEIFFSSIKNISENK